MSEEYSARYYVGLQSAQPLGVGETAVVSATASPSAGVLRVEEILVSDTTREAFVFVEVPDLATVSRASPFEVAVRNVSDAPARFVAALVCTPLHTPCTPSRTPEGEPNRCCLS